MHSAAEYTVRDQDRMKRATRYFEWQFRLAQAQLGARVLEIGCGLGNFTQHLADRELVVGIDAEPDCIAAHRARFAGRANLVSLCLDVVSPEFSKLREHRPDSVACLNVLEHVRDDAAALENIHAVLPEGGRAVLIVPAFESLYGPIDERLGHYRRYNKKSLTLLAERAGFRAEALRYMNSVGFFGWWFNAHVARKTAQSEAQIAVFDAVVVPVLSRLEAWMEPAVGQSIFAVLCKRTGERDFLTGQTRELVGRGENHGDRRNCPRGAGPHTDLPNSALRLGTVSSVPRFSQLSAWTRPHL